MTGTQTVEPTSPSIADILTKEVPGFGAGGGGGVTVPPLGVTLPLPPTKSASPLEPANNLGVGESVKLTALATPDVPFTIKHNSKIVVPSASVTPVTSGSDHATAKRPLLLSLEFKFPSLIPKASTLVTSTNSNTDGSHPTENCKDRISSKLFTVTGTQTVEPMSPLTLPIFTISPVLVGGGGGGGAILLTLIVAFV